MLRFTDHNSHRYNCREHFSASILEYSTNMKYTSFHLNGFFKTQNILHASISPRGKPGRADGKENVLCANITITHFIHYPHTSLSHTINMNQTIMQMNNEKALSDSLISSERPVVFGCPLEKRLGK